MASTVDHDSAKHIDGLLRNGSWSEACEFIAGELGDARRLRPSIALAHAIALIRSGRERDGLSLLDADVLACANARSDLRRYVVSPLVDAKQIELAASVLDLILSAYPDSPEDLRLRSSLLGRLKRWSDAIRDSEFLAHSRPDDLAAQTSFIQQLLQAGQLERAGSYAETVIDKLEGHPRLANIALMALIRSGKLHAAAEAAAELAETDISDELLAVAIVRTLFDAGFEKQTIKTGERFLADGWEDPMIRSFVGQAYMVSQVNERYSKAIEHFKVGLDFEPDDVRMNSLMGEALLRSRDYDRAIPYLERACKFQPKVPHARALYARALKQTGRFTEAAGEFRRLLEQQPSSSRWRRYAAGALSQAGRRKEAAELFDAFVDERKKTLPRSFEEGLKVLWDRVDSVSIPQARLDWAWNLSKLRSNDRGEWERTARWGNLADHYFLDWLECRDDRVHEAMARLADLSEPERAFAEVGTKQGIILASAHIGPMYAGPLALELLGIRSRWLASTPSVARTSYSDSLISTSDQDDMQVARAFMGSLRKGYAVVLAVDGAINLAAPRIQFEGQEMTYSSFAARTAHRLGVPSMFCAPRWEGDRIGFILSRLPDPDFGESADSHAERWRNAFLVELREYLSGAPENLRLSGGLWRHIR